MRLSLICKLYLSCKITYKYMDVAYWCGTRFIFVMTFELCRLWYIVTLISSSSTPNCNTATYLKCIISHIHACHCHSVSSIHNNAWADYFPSFFWLPRFWLPFSDRDRQWFSRVSQRSRSLALVIAGLIFITARRTLAQSTVCVTLVR